MSDEYDDTPITDADWAAADEVMQGLPESDSDKRERFRRHAAYLHARWGDDKFRLRHGLRPPRNEYEIIDQDYYLGKISREEFKKKREAFATRPCDEQMLKALVDGLENQLVNYGLFMQTIVGIAHQQSDCTEDHADRCIRAINRKLDLPSREILTTVEFLTEARVKQRQPIVQLKGITAATAAELIILIMTRVQDQWVATQETAYRSQTDPRYSYATTAGDLFWQICFENFPVAQDLKTLLHQEQAVGRIVLAEALKAPRDQVRAESIDVNIHGTNVNLSIARRGKSVPRAAQDKRPPRLTVEKWSDLAVGLDELRKAWAVTPPPMVGSVFPKRQSIELPLKKKKQMSKVLQAFGDSDDGIHADLQTVAAALGLLPPPSKLPPEPRARNASLQQGYSAELPSKSSSWRTELNRILADLARKFRQLVDGPTALDGDAAFAMDKESVHCAFVVRYLLRNENGDLQFGQKPGS